MGLPFLVLYTIVFPIVGFTLIVKYQNILSKP